MALSSNNNTGATDWTCTGLEAKAEPGSEPEPGQALEEPESQPSGLGQGLGLLLLLFWATGANTSTCSELVDADAEMLRWLKLKS